MRWWRSRISIVRPICSPRSRVVSSRESTSCRAEAEAQEKNGAPANCPGPVLFGQEYRLLLRRHLSKVEVHRPRFDVARQVERLTKTVTDAGARRIRLRVAGLRDCAFIVIAWAQSIELVGT